MKRTPLKRGKPMKRRVRLRAVNWARLKARRAACFGPQAALCRSMPCLACWATPCDPHHVLSRGAGGLDCHCVPLCRKHHSQFHSLGRLGFEQAWGVDLFHEAARLAETVARGVTP